jgi:hypothetical protein
LPFARLIGGRLPGFSGFLEKFFGLKGRRNRADELGKAVRAEARELLGLQKKSFAEKPGFKWAAKDCYS